MESYRTGSTHLGYSRPQLASCHVRQEIFADMAKPPRMICTCRSILPLGQNDESYAASRRVISARAARPSSVNEYGASNSGPVFFTKCFLLRYCMSAFIDLRGILSASVTSLMRSAPESRIVESTLRTRSDSTGRRGTAAWRAD